MSRRYDSSHIDRNANFSIPAEALNPNIVLSSPPLSLLPAVSLPSPKKCLSSGSSLNSHALVSHSSSVRSESEALTIAKKMLSSPSSSKNRDIANTKNRNGETMLMTSAKYGHFRVMEYLLSSQFPVDVNVINEAGCSALTFAIRNADFPSVALLVSYGADFEQAVLKSGMPRLTASYTLEQRIMLKETIVQSVMVYNSWVDDRLCHSVWPGIPRVLSEMICNYVCTSEFIHHKLTMLERRSNKSKPK